MEAQFIISAGILVTEIVFKLIGFTINAETIFDVADCFENQQGSSITISKINIMLSISLGTTAGCIGCTLVLHFFIYRYFCLNCQLNDSQQYCKFY
jgi:hypothetical protein